MSSGPTEYQNEEEQRRSRELSKQPSRPPGTASGYELQRQLGTGAYGEVWVGLDRNTGRRVAVKFYLHRGGLDWTLLSREVEKLVFLSADRYVVQLLDVGWDAEPPYYVMEYVENGSLDDLLRERGSLPAEGAVEMFRDVAIGLTHAHAKGVLHCDLKPANILLDQDRRPRLADFGQSRLSHEQTPALGTLFYMAPEQANLEAVPDARWDVYALGALLYSMLTGSPPYRDDGTIRRIEAATDLAKRLECYRQHIKEAPLPSQHRETRGVDGALAEIMDRCLAVEPDERYSNAQTVLDALDARQQHRARRPLLVLGLLGPVLLLLVMALFYWHGFGRAVSQSEDMVNDQTYKSSEFAAKFIAKSFEAELAEYFEIVEQEASRTDLQAELIATFESTVLGKLSDARTEEEQIETLRQQFLVEPQRLSLRTYLEKCLASYNENPRADASKFASIIALDEWGTIVAVAYAEGDITTRSVGKNYSWRTYFHGGQEDAERVRPQELPQHISATHLSAVFKSTTTERWRVAVSTPVYDTSVSPRRFLGVIAFTINVGDFAIFRSSHDPTGYFAVLIDNRDGERKGTILQHPVFKAKPPARDYRVTETQLARIRGEPEYKYRDPLAEASGGDAYASNWIAATEPVRLPGRGQVVGDGTNRTDLLVLVQVGADMATAPVDKLGNRLALVGMMALTVVILVIVALWLVVLRILGVSARIRPRENPAEPDPTSIHSTPTIAADGHERR